ncbi:hypothetical protein ACFOWA_19460 [Pedobacter lithocola]|uniref:Uncharacterized protein n=1 Tax=Pedobacter lithocola TaxID=1908239 RepID=A0ABV8PE54_9SPHI
MKYLITGLIILLTGIGLGILEVMEIIPDPMTFVEHHRPIGIKKLLAPYLVMCGMIITFVGVISICYNRPKKKRNYLGR